MGLCPGDDEWQAVEDMDHFRHQIPLLYSQTLLEMDKQMIGFALPGVIGPIGDVAAGSSMAAGGLGLGASEDAATGGVGPQWAGSASDMDEILGFMGERVPDGPLTPGRGKVIWSPNEATTIVGEQHPYHEGAPGFHSGWHYHFDGPGFPRHQRFLPGEPLPNWPVGG